MPIDLVIDERESTKPIPELGGSTNGNDGRSNADSASHTDGASTPDVVSVIAYLFIFIIFYSLYIHFCLRKSVC